MIRVLLADDHSLVRQGMKQLLSFSDDIRVIGEAATGDEVLQALDTDEFDIILLDMSMPGISGAELIASIRQTVGRPPVLVLTMHCEPHLAKHTLLAGAGGFLTKDCPPDVLEIAIRTVVSGKRYIQSDIAEKLIFDTPPPAQAAHARLSPQELRILKMFANGLRVVDIADELALSSRTVSTHKMRLMQKLDLDNDVDLIRYADANGLK